MKDKKKDKKEKKKIKELEKSGGDFRTSNIFRSNDKNYTVNQYNNNNNIEEESAGLLFIPNEQTQSSPANFESLIHLSEIPTNILENFRIATLSNSQPNVSSRAVDFEYSYPKQADIFSPTPMVPQISLSTSMGNVPTSMKSTQYSLQFPLSPISPLSPPPHSPVTSPLPFSLPSPNLFAPPLPLSPQPSPQFSPQFQESNCKWNDLFQYSMKEFFQSDRKKREEYMANCENLANLAKNFVYTATLFGQIIINEFHLPQNKKSYHPSNVGGQAGGIKYIIHDILFKLATDENVIKIAGHELKSLDNLLTCKVDDLCFPMLAIIDYRGFRLIAISTLPIDKTTIKYGSADGGQTVHNSHPDLAYKIKTACSMLNLSSRFVYSYKNSNQQNELNQAQNQINNQVLNSQNNLQNNGNNQQNLNAFSYPPSSSSSSSSASAATPPPSVLSPAPPSPSSPLQFGYLPNTHMNYLNNNYNYNHMSNNNTINNTNNTNNTLYPPNPNYSMEMTYNSNYPSENNINNNMSNGMSYNTNINTNINGSSSNNNINALNPNTYIDNYNLNANNNNNNMNNNNNINNLIPFNNSNDNLNFYQYSYDSNNQFFVNNNNNNNNGQLNENMKEIYGPIDLEGHVGKDGKYYLVDFSRLFPPDIPQNFNNYSSYLFQLLRPEIVKINPFPLCSDSLSNFVQNNEEKAKYYHEINQTFLFLLQKRIPNFVEILARKNPSLYQPVHLIQSIHRCGINIRYIGKIRFLLLQFNSNYAREWANVILIEMISRTLKWILKERLRKTSEFNPFQIPIDIPFKQTIVKFMNEIFGDNQISFEFWNQLEYSIQLKFNQEFFSEKGNVRTFLFQSSNAISQLFDRFCEMMGIHFSPCVKSNFLMFRHQNPFDLAHLKDISPRVKQLHLVNYCEGMSLYLQSKTAQLDTKKYLYQLSLDCFERSLECNPSSVDSLVYCAKLNSKLGKLERAKIYFELAMNINIKDPYPILQFARFSEKVKYDVITAEKYYLLALQANANFVPTLLHYARFLTLNSRNESDTKRALACFWKAKKFIHANSPYYLKLSQFYVAFLRVSLAVKTEESIHSALHQLMTSS